MIVCWTTVIQRRTPGELLGRAAAAGEALASIPYVGAIGLGSALVTLIDFRLLSAGAAVGFVFASVYLTRAPVLRESARTHQQAHAAVPADSA